MSAPALCALVAAFRADKCAATAQAIVDAINAAPELVGRIPSSTLTSVFRHAGVFAALERS